MSTFCTSPEELGQFVKWLFWTAAAGAFVGAGGVSLVRDGMREAFWIWRANRRLLRLRRKAA